MIYGQIRRKYPNAEPLWLVDKKGICELFELYVKMNPERIMHGYKIRIEKVS